MRIYLFLLIVLSGCASLIDNYSNQKTPRQPTSRVPLLPVEPKIKTFKKVAFADFINLTGYDVISINDKLFDFFKRNIEKLDGIGIIKLKETEYYTDKRFDIERLRNAGQRENAFGLISGIIEDIEVNEGEKDTGILGSREVTLSTKINYKYFDLSSGKELLSKTFFADTREERISFLKFSKSEPEFYSLVEKTAEKAWEELKDVFESFRWGIIVEINPPKYFVTFNKPILNLVSNERLSVRGQEQESLKGVLKVVEIVNPREVIAILETGSGFLVNDIVEFSSQKSY